MHVPSMSQDIRLQLARSRTSHRMISRVNMKQSQSPFSNTGDVRSKLENRISPPSVVRAVTQRRQNFSVTFHSFCSRIARTPPLRENLGGKFVTQSADKETTCAPKLFRGPKLRRWNWTLPTLSRYRPNYRKLNTHTDSSTCAYTRLRTRRINRRKLAVLNFRGDQLTRCPETQF